MSCQCVHIFIQVQILMYPHEIASTSNILYSWSPGTYFFSFAALQCMKMREVIKVINWKNNFVSEVWKFERIGRNPVLVVYHANHACTSAHLSPLLIQTNNSHNKNQKLSLYVDLCSSQAPHFLFFMTTITLKGSYTLQCNEAYIFSIYVHNLFTYITHKSGYKCIF